MWLKTLKINTLIFCGVDTSICVETSLEMDLILAMMKFGFICYCFRKKEHYDTTIERIRDYYGIITDLSDLQKMIKKLEQINSGEIEYDIKSDESVSEFLEKHKLIDLRKGV